MKAARWCSKSVEDMTKRIDDPALDITENDVIVMRNAGPIGAPGMPEAGYIPIPKKLAQKGVKDMVRISDARMSGTAFGTIVLHIAPEVRGRRAARAGENRRSHQARCRSAQASNAGQRCGAGTRRKMHGRRRRCRTMPQRGYAKLYREHVQQADEGCDFDFLAAVKALSSDDIQTALAFRRCFCGEGRANSHASPATCPSRADRSRVVAVSARTAVPSQPVILACARATTHITATS